MALIPNQENKHCVVSRVCLAQQDHSRFTYKRAQVHISAQSEVTLKIIMHNREVSVGDDGSTPALVPMGQVFRSLKQGNNAPTKWTLVQQKLF